MFDFAWTEIALIGVVALIAIGPKDLPVAIKTVAAFVKKARRMAAEFQTHVDDLVREADLHEVRDQINQIRNFDIRGEIEKAVDADGSIRSTLNTNPLVTPPPATPLVQTSTNEAGTIEAGSGGAEHHPADPIEGASELRAEPAGQSRNVSETRVLERPAETVVPAEAGFPPPAEPPAFIPPGMSR